MHGSNSNIRQQQQQQFMKGKDHDYPKDLSFPKTYLCFVVEKPCPQATLNEELLACLESPCRQISNEIFLK